MSGGGEEAPEFALWYFEIYSSISKNKMVFNFSQRELTFNEWKLIRLAAGGGEGGEGKDQIIPDVLNPQYLLSLLADFEAIDVAQ